MKKELIFLGPPACGKGKQKNRLSVFLLINFGNMFFPTYIISY